MNQLPALSSENATADVAGAKSRGQPKRKKKGKGRKQPKTAGTEPNGIKPTLPLPYPSPPELQANRFSGGSIYFAPNMVNAPRVSVAKPLTEFQRFCDLPPELQKLIFELAYCSSGQNNWVLISRKVREWLEPFIYASIVLPFDFEYLAEKRLPLYERTFQSRPKEFYARTVKRIFTNNSTSSRSSDFELKLLPICDNLSSLECWSDRRDELITILKTKYWPNLKTLCLDIDLLPKDDTTFQLPLFRHVTHLDICSEEVQLPSWKSLSSLDNLTHMRVYMLVKVQRGHFRSAMDLVYAIAIEAQKCFPRNLKHFVILVPIDLLYYIASLKPIAAEDKERWNRLESIRVGTFDSRIMLGSCGDWEKWLGQELLDADEEGEMVLAEYCQFVAQLTYPNLPRDYFDDEEKDPWAEVVTKNRRRMRLLAPGKK